MYAVGFSPTPPALPAYGGLISLAGLGTFRAALSQLRGKYLLRRSAVLAGGGIWALPQFLFRCIRSGCFCLSYFVTYTTSQRKMPSEDSVNTMDDVVIPLSGKLQGVELSLGSVEFNVVDV